MSKSGTRLSVVALAAALAPFGLVPPAFADTNCWGIPRVKHRFDRTLVSSDRCDIPVFHLTKGEGDRNIRSSPSSLRIIGKMNEVGDHSLFESRLIVTYDDGKTYWAFGEAFSEQNSNRRIKGWVEVGDTSAIVQYDLPGTNDLWYKF